MEDSHLFHLIGDPHRIDDPDRVQLSHTSDKVQTALCAYIIRSDYRLICGASKDAITL
jgi:hypothetical protein